MINIDDYQKALDGEISRVSKLSAEKSSENVYLYFKYICILYINVYVYVKVLPFVNKHF